MSAVRPETRDEEERTTVRVDGDSYSVRFRGFGADLLVEEPAVRLRPWTLGAHLRVLDLHGEGEDLSSEMDAGSLCAAVLAEVSVRYHALLQPLALWWATCGGAQPESDGEFLRCGPARVKLRPWSLYERARAISSATAKRQDGAHVFWPGRYLLAMARESIVASEPALPLSELPGAVPLVAALVRANVAAEEEDLGDLHLIRSTLRLCRGLGWSAERAWALPAAEADRLLRLLDRADSGADRIAAEPRVRMERRASLLDDPDAILIQVEDG